jgi:hypothetical protein
MTKKVKAEALVGITKMEAELSDEIPKKRFLISGTMRGGSSLVSSILNAHSNVLALGEYIHFFRFLYREADPPNVESFSQKLEEMRLRLFYRYNLQFESDRVLADVRDKGVSYQNLYDAVLRYFLEQAGKEIGGEDAALNWTTIPEYLRLFPDGKVIQIIRDPRAVLASWHKSSYHETKYLDAIFNCIDNMEKCLTYQKILSQDNYMFVRYEDVITQPEETARKFCEFIGIEFEPLMIHPERWDELFDGVLVKRGWSSFTGSMKNKGFDKSRMNAWEKNLDDWELCLCEMLTGERLTKFDYDFSEKKFSHTEINKSVEILRQDSFLVSRYMKWFLTNEGSEGYPEDPTDPFSWGGSEDYKKRFVDTKKGKEYLSKMAKLQE